ncbi:hypothetical protein BJX62DRAFT_235935 [Aspergillus germanicus]
MPPKDLGKANLAGGILNLTVGPSETPFDDHLELLCECSPYFNSRLSERFDDTFIKELAFPEEDPEAFADLIRWAYTGTLDISLHKDNNNYSTIGNTSGSTEPDLILHLFRVWILADKFLAPQLMELAMARCEVEMNADPGRLVSCSAVRFAYIKSTPPPSTSTLCKFVVGVWGERAGRRTLSDVAAHELPRDFVRDVDGLVSGGGKDNPGFDRDRTPTQTDLDKIKEPALKATPQVLANRRRMSLPTRRRVTAHSLSNLRVTIPQFHSAMEKRYQAPTASELGLLD